MTTKTKGITVHRALTELKTLDARIREATDVGTFIDTRRKSTKNIKGKTVKEYENRLQGHFDKVKDLIDRRNAVKSAIVKSNAETIVTVAGKDMTVAEAIERKNSIEYEEEFLAELKQQYRLADGKVTRHNDNLNVAVESHLEAVLGPEGERKKEDVEHHTKAYLERHEMVLVDPLDLYKKIEELTQEIYDFKEDVDAALSESNAVTRILE